MKTVVIIQDIDMRTFIIDRYNTQLIRDYLRSASETEFVFEGQDRKTVATFYGSGKGRVKMVSVRGKGGHLARSVDELIDSLLKSNNVEIKCDEASFTNTFYEFIRVSHDLPETLVVINDLSLTYDECELHFTKEGMLIVHAPKHGAIASDVCFHPMNTESIEIVTDVIPLCIDYMNEVHKVQRVRYDKHVAESKGKR